MKHPFQTANSSTAVLFYIEFAFLSISHSTTRILKGVLMANYLDHDALHRLRKSKEFLEKNGKTIQNIESVMNNIVLAAGVTPHQRQILTDEILPRLYAFSGLKKYRGEVIRIK